ncbi:NTP transferase domain-containing protein [Rheinheimera marina]|uniref:NTP transferase domain-containing protein n=1 Tax=Rheinheimera marina TaxID=1774958 RepID=A0ABV9JRN8_9GAMM
MKAIILAAGLGSRLRPYTDNCPKTLVKLAGKPLLEHQLAVLGHAGINDIVLVTGYLSQQFDRYGFTQYFNPDYASSNMLFSLMCARGYFDGQRDVLICYGDIVYNDRVLQTVLRQQGDVVVAADLDWQQLWQLRMEDPLTDAESFQLAADGRRVLQLGQKMTSLSQAEAQYIGLVKCSAAVHERLLAQYDALPPARQRQMYMTDFLQLLIHAGIEVNAALHQGGWLEVDSTADLLVYHQYMEQLLQK